MSTNLARRLHEIRDYSCSAYEPTTFSICELKAHRLDAPSAADSLPWGARSWPFASVQHCRQVAASDWEEDDCNDSLQSPTALPPVSRAVYL